MTSKELGQMKKPELKDMAKDAGLKVTSRMTKAQIISALTLHYTAKEAGKAAARVARKKPTKTKQPKAETASKTLSRMKAKTQNTAKPAVQTTATSGEISTHYDESRVVLMIRDPHWIHAYWELAERSLSQARDYFGPRWSTTKHILRVYDITGTNLDDKENLSSFDVAIDPEGSNWYVNVPSADRNYCIEIGILGTGGDFFSLARSNAIRPPRSDVSDVVDEKWARKEEDFEEVYTLSGAHQIGIGSLEAREQLAQRFEEELASGLVSSMASAAPEMVHGRGFRFVVDAELILYGATEPDATVTIQGTPVKLRPDGTFTLRYALPNGRQFIPAVAISADGIEERTITLSITRRTEVKQPRIMQQV